MNKQKGVFGELLAKKYLERKLYSIIEQNWTCHWGEIDLVCQKNTNENNLIVFVEVKFRTSTTYGYAYEAITQKKLQSLKRSISYYLLEKRIQHEDWRLDAVLIQKTKGRWGLQHLEGV